MFIRSGQTESASVLFSGSFFYFLFWLHPCRPDQLTLSCFSENSHLSPQKLWRLTNGLPISLTVGIMLLVQHRKTKVKSCRWQSPCQITKVRLMKKTCMTLKKLALILTKKKRKENGGVQRKRNDYSLPKPDEHTETHTHTHSDSAPTECLITEACRKINEGIRS